MEYYTELEKKHEKISMKVSIDAENNIFTRFSSLNRAKRVIAWCKKLAQKIRNKTSITSSIEADELIAARDTLVRLSQQEYFQEELNDLGNLGRCKKSSKLMTLNPFIDGNGIMRVGGRLENSDFSYDKKHPMIIPYNSILAKWIIRDAHQQVMHGGNQLTLAQIRHTYWIPAAKRAVRTMINQCIICHRFRAKATQQLMGSLPAARTKTATRAFTHTGTDLCGPILLKMTAGRGVKSQKGYIVIFICMTTRAIHIEIVSDLTAEAFIAAFKRFVGRRGNVPYLYCDNGLNFVGANKILQLENEQAINEFDEKIKDELANCNTRFNFNPPSAPWFGGLWERNIGSIKYHLKRTIGDRSLTYEELSTVLTQIEACINSRPICPLTDDISDLNTLTPGHFLIGSALTAPVEGSLLQLQENRLDRWQMCNRLKQQFWEKWSSDYVANLQKRPKWNEIESNLKEGELVLVMDEINPPLRWPLGRITKTYPGADGLVRVLKVEMKGKTYKRPVGKLSKLPIDVEKMKPKVSKNDEKIKTKGSCIKNGTLLSLLAFIMLLTVVCGEQANYAVKNFSNKTWFYAEKCDRVIATSGTWNIFAGIN